ncbi:hypothetical protein [Streptomyces sp. WG5]|uniref:hypothetical protein n=1 Tax=Streptomyces sp. WG5 TaxID=3417648 RepID=UPI003CE9302A
MSDAWENDLIESATVVLGLVKAVLSGPQLTADESWFMPRRTAECLADALNVAELRGERLAAADEEAPPCGRGGETKGGTPRTGCRPLSVVRSRRRSVRVVG